MDLHEEKELIKLAQKDREVFAHIYDHYYPNIFGYVLKRTADLEAAQDITSETFFKALKHLWQFRWRNLSFSSWLYKIATNEVNQYFRKGRFRPASLDELREQGFEPVSLRCPESELMEIQERLDRYEAFSVYRERISRLDTKYQEVIALRFFEHKKIKEIGEILGKSEGTIKSLLHRGLDKLRQAKPDESGTQPFAKPRIIDSDRSNNLTQVSQGMKSCENFE